MDQVLCLDDIEVLAERALPKSVFDYYRTGADALTSLADNRNAFSRYRLNPRVLVDVSKRSLKTRVLGEEMAMPIGISPLAMHRMAHPEGELASARAAQEAGTIFTLSTASTSSIEEVAEAAPKGLKWFQLYVYKDRKVSEALVRRAEAAGFKALVVTLDAPVIGNRLADVRNKFELPQNLMLKNFQGLLPEAEGFRHMQGSGVAAYVNGLFDPSLTWKDLDWLKSITKLPLVLKGILRPDDAMLAVKHGASAVFVSNHGGRQLDGAPAPIDALPRVVEAVRQTDPSVEVYMDGGIRSGTDILKAIAMGARMVLIGRPVVYGLAAGGQKGVEKTLTILRSELDRAMALTGFTDVTNVNDQELIWERCCTCGGTGDTKSSKLW